MFQKKFVVKILWISAPCPFFYEYVETDKSNHLISVMTQLLPPFATCIIT